MNDLSWPLGSAQSVRPGTTVETLVDTTTEPCAKLLATAKILVLLETSAETELMKNDLIESVVSFIKTNAGTSRPAIGIVNYGSTVEVAVDIGNYENEKELEEEIRDIHFVGGNADIKLAIKTALELFSENDDGKDHLQQIVHIHKTPLR